MIRYVVLLGGVIIGWAVPGMVFAKTADNHREWNFVISLDGQPVGTHKFTVDEVPGMKGKWHVTSRDDFTVSLLGVSVFHYHHTAQEQWSHQCLSQLVADTDHDGDISHVTAEGTASGGTVHTVQNEGADQAKSWTGCLMSYAYWNPDMPKQTRLLNPENGEINEVSIAAEPDIEIMAHGQPLRAHVWRVTGSANPIDILYDDRENWVGLDAKVRGDRMLSYRLP